MSVLPEIAAEWKKSRLEAEGYYCRLNRDDDGIYAGEISSQWRQHFLFQEFVRSHSGDDRKALQQAEQTEMPRIASNILHRSKHPDGYHIFKKKSTAAREERVFSEFAAACDFPYAPILLDESGYDIHTPKLGNNVTSLFGYLINALAKESDDVPLELRESFHRAVKEHGSPHKIPYNVILNQKQTMFINLPASKESSAYTEWATPFLQRERTFLSKMRAMLSLMGTCEEYFNGTNIIVNAQTGKFLYAIDQHPKGDDFTFDLVPSMRRRLGISLDELTDPDIVVDMQETMKEKITDELIDKMMDMVRAYTYSYQGSNDFTDIRLMEKVIAGHKEDLRLRRDKPAPIIDTNTMMPI